MITSLLTLIAIGAATYVVFLQMRRWTAVSNAPGTDVKLPNLSFSLIFVAGVVLLFVMRGEHLAWARFFVILAVTCCAVAQLAWTYRKGTRSRHTRYQTALANPEFSAARFAMFFSAPYLRDPSHVTMWLGPLGSLGFPFVVVAKERWHFEKLRKISGLRVLMAGNLNASCEVVPQNVRAVFYANNGMQNTNVMNHHDDLVHVQLLHGDSDKPPSYNAVSRAFDRLFVAGQMGIDRYGRNRVAISKDKFRIVGRPQFASRGATKSHKNKRTIVYMPTWGGMFNDSDFSSFSDAPAILSQICRVHGITDIVFKPHPLTLLHHKPSPTLSAVQDAVASCDVAFRLAPATEDAFDLYDLADVLVTDISSTIIDYLYSGKPYVVTNPRGFGDAELKRFPSVSGGYLCKPDASDVAEQVALALGEDPMAAKRAEVQAYAFGDLDRPPGEAFREACYEILGRP